MLISELGGDTKYFLSLDVKYFPSLDILYLKIITCFVAFFS